MALGLLDLCIWLPLSLSFLIVNLATMKPLPYHNWKQVHANFNAVAFYDADKLKSSSFILTELSRWEGPIVAMIFFLFFGIKPESWSTWIKILGDSWLGRTVNHFVSKRFDPRLQEDKHGA